MTLFKELVHYPKFVLDGIILRSTLNTKVRFNQAITDNDNFEAKQRLI